MFRSKSVFKILSQTWAVHKKLTSLPSASNVSQQLRWEQYFLLSSFHLKEDRDVYRPQPKWQCHRSESCLKTQFHPHTHLPLCYKTYFSSCPVYKFPSQHWIVLLSREGGGTLCSYPSSSFFSPPYWAQRTQGSAPTVHISPLFNNPVFFCNIFLSPLGIKRNFAPLLPFPRRWGDLFLAQSWKTYQESSVISLLCPWTTAWPRNNHLHPHLKVLKLYVVWVRGCTAAPTSCNPCGNRKRSKIVLKFLLLQQVCGTALQGWYKMSQRSKSKVLWNTLSYAKWCGCLRSLNRNIPLLWLLWSITFRGKKWYKGQSAVQRGNKPRWRWLGEWCRAVAFPAKRKKKKTWTHRLSFCLPLSMQPKAQLNGTYYVSQANIAVPVAIRGIPFLSFCFALSSHQAFICTSARQSCFLPVSTESRLGSNYNFHSAPNLQGFFCPSPDMYFL